MEEEHSSEATVEVDEEFEPPLYANGVFGNPWDTWADHTVWEVLEWTFKRPFFGTTLPPHVKREIKSSLPVLPPDWDVINNPGKILPGHKDKKDENEQDPNNGTEQETREGVQLTWVGHSTFLVQMEDLNFLTDPIWSFRCSPVSFLGPKRLRPVPFKIEELPPVDFVVVSHAHYDHLDYPTVTQLGNAPRWYVPLGLKQWFESCGITNVEELGWWDSAKYVRAKDGKSVTVVCTPCQHWANRTLTDKCTTLWASWAILGKKHRVFFAGDTGYCPVFKKIGRKYGPFDVGLIPIGAYCPRDFMAPQHVDPKEAIKVHLDVKSRVSVAMHWGTFHLSDEHPLEPPLLLKEEMREAGVPADEFVVMYHGETKFFEGYFDSGKKEQELK